jgi:hypothetical protein
MSVTRWTLTLAPPVDVVSCAIDLRVLGPL